MGQGYFLSGRASEDATHPLEDKRYQQAKQILIQEKGRVIQSRLW